MSWNDLLQGGEYPELCGTIQFPEILIRYVAIEHSLRTMRDYAFVVDIEYSVIDTDQ